MPAKPTPYTPPDQAPYIGRFAPSPTGELHLGSLLAALASYVDAKAHNGKWLIRIEDLDPLREHPGASESFLALLEHYHLLWDDSVLKQSERLALYADAAQQLLDQNQAYPCECSRTSIKTRTGSNMYDGFCIDRWGTYSSVDSLVGKAAIRCKFIHHQIIFSDRIQPSYEPLTDDFIIRRRDGLTAYQLAVVVDDAIQGITHIVRGSDLLNETSRQACLQHHLGFTTPSYAHIPVLCYSNGQKLSKQNFAQPLSVQQDPREALLKALTLLNQNPPSTLRASKPEEILNWAIEHWDLNRIPKQLSIFDNALAMPSPKGS